MSDPQPERGDEPPRLAPRPLHRPSVDAGSAELFGRPDGVPGSFDPVNEDSASRESNGARRIELTPPHHALVSAFGRPAGDAADLQRLQRRQPHLDRARPEELGERGGDGEDPRFGAAEVDVGVD